MKNKVESREQGAGSGERGAQEGKNGDGLELSFEVIGAAISNGVEAWLNRAEMAGKVADALARRFEVLTAEETAALLKVTRETLMKHHVAWGLDKSVALGITNPRFFLSQVLEALAARKSKGARKAEIRLVESGRAA